MELAPNNDPWTATVAWARPWHRPARRRIPLPDQSVRSCRPAAVRPADDISDDTWTAALLHVTRARARRDLLESQPDAWSAIVANHEVHLAVSRARALADRLELMTGQLAGSRQPR